MLGLLAWGLLLLPLAALAADDSFQLQMHASPTEADEYCDTRFRVPAEFAGGHVVGVEPLAGSAAHHIILFWCEETVPKDAPLQDDCASHERGAPCGNFLYVWAQNGGPMYFPPNVGLLLGEGGARSFGLQTHYGHGVPAGFVDASGVRLIVSRRKAAMWLQPDVTLLAPMSSFVLQPGQEQYILSLPPQSLHVSQPTVLFAVRTHAHSRGVWNSVTVSRQGKPVWAFRRSTRLVQSFQPLDQLFTLLPGDVAHFQCVYDTRGETHLVRQGATKHDEMCNVYLMGWLEPAAFSVVSKLAPGLAQSQIVGVTASRDRGVWLFHRGSRVWDSKSFGSNDNFQQGPIPDAVLMELDAVSGEVLRVTGENSFYMPHAVRADPVEGNILWLVDVGSHTLSKFDTDTNKVVAVAGTKLQPQRDDAAGAKKGFCKPTDVAFSTDGALAYVSDGYCNRRIVVLRRSDMSVQAVFPVQADVVHSLVVADCAGHDVLLVCDRERGRVLALRASDGAMLREIVGWAQGWLPYGVALASRGRVVVALVERRGAERTGALWVSLDMAACSADAAALQGTFRKIPALAEPHLLHTYDAAFVLVAEAVDETLKGGLWKVYV
jgi:DNA-binding beta-propeller fold protein YncE